MTPTFLARATGSVPLGVEESTSNTIDAGKSHTCAIRTDGTVECWGANSYGWAGKPTPEGSFVALSGGGHHTCGLRTDGTVECWGNDFKGQSTAPPGSFTAIAAGWEHTCGGKTDGTVVYWGYDDGRTTPPSCNYGQPRTADR